MQHRKLEMLHESELTLETERLRLSCLSLADIDIIGALYTDRKVMKFLGDLIPEEDVPQEMQKAIQRGAGGRIGCWCIADRSSGEKLGYAVLLTLPI